MKLSEFLEVAKDSETFYIKKVGETISDDDEVCYRDDLEVENLSNSEVKEVTFKLEVEKSCKYILDIIPVIFIYTEVDKFCDEFLKS